MEKFADTVKFVEFDSIKLEPEKKGGSRVLRVALEKDGKTVKTGTLSFDVLRGKDHLPTDKLRLDIGTSTYKDELVMLFDLKHEQGPKANVKPIQRAPGREDMALDSLEAEAARKAPSKPLVSLKMENISWDLELAKKGNLDLAKVTRKLEDAMNGYPLLKDWLADWEDEIRHLRRFELLK